MISDIMHHLRGNVSGIIHVGAHTAEEMDFYFDIGANKIIWYEPTPRLYKDIQYKIKDDPRQSVKNLAVSNFCGKVKFNIETDNDGQSSSLLDLKDHEKYYPHIKYNDFIEVECVTLDSEHLDGFQALFIDTQGSDYHVLRGAEELVRNSIKYIYCEVFTEELYTGCGMLEDIDNCLKTLKFDRVYLSKIECGSGNALYIKT